jgi:hypothetical protein
MTAAAASRRCRPVVGGLCLTILAACTQQRDSAQRAVSDIQTVIAAASSEASKDVPDQLADVQGRLAALEAEVERGDYAAVQAAAPDVMRDAQGLAGAAGAKRRENARALDAEWSSLAAVVPADMTALDERIDGLARRSSHKPATGVDLDAARGTLSRAASLWSKAQAAFATGNLPEAVTTARTVRENLETLDVALRTGSRPRD